MGQYCYVLVYILSELFILNFFLLKLDLLINNSLMKTLKRLLFFIAGICLLIACSKSDGFWRNDSFRDNSKNGHNVQIGDNQNCPIVNNKYIPGTILTFSGKTIYKYVQVIGNYVLADMYCPNEAKITFLEDREIELFITENGDCGGRSFYAYGQITPSGSTKFEYAIPVITLPDGTGLKITDVIQGHLGCTINGPGIDRGTLVFFGKFDGSTLVATSYFNSKCDVAWPNNNIFTTPVNGPVQCSWTYNLTLDK